MISVVICSCGRINLIKKTILSLIEASELYKDFEIIVVDNTNGTEIASLLEEYKNKANITYAREEEKGVSYARNRGIRQAKGEVIAFVDDDAWVDKQWLKEIDVLFRENDCAACGGKIFPVFTKSLPMWIKKWGLADHHGIIISHNLGDTLLDYKAGMAFAFTTNVAIRKASLLQYGMFRTDLAVCEDMEISQRLLNSGERIIYNPKMIVFHAIEPYRLSKLFYLRWHFRTGFNNAKIAEGLYAKRDILGIPAYTLRNLSAHFIKLIGYSLRLNGKEVFANLLGLSCDLGFILGKVTTK
jgi:glycosyltransferase involved in cell wall biosynthesis